MKKIITLLLWSTCTQAAEIDFTVVIAGPSGPFKECQRSDDTGKCLELVDLTLRSICATAAGLPDKNLSFSEQQKRGRLARKILRSDHLALPAEDIALLKQQIAKLGYSTIAVDQAGELLDPASVEK